MGYFWKVILSNHILNVGVASWFCAQILKTLHTFIKYKELRWERLTGAGGMPSSHSALVCSVTLAMAKMVGYSSPLFALTFCFAAIVMYDAMGVRRAAGEQAKVINKMMFTFKDADTLFERLGKEIESEFSEFGGADPIHKEQSPGRDATQQRALKEFLGHTPLEVLGGALVGILMASLLPVP